MGSPFYPYHDPDEGHPDQGEPRIFIGPEEGMPEEVAEDDLEEHGADNAYQKQAAENLLKVLEEKDDPAFSTFFGQSNSLIPVRVN